MAQNDSSVKKFLELLPETDVYGFANSIFRDGIFSSAIENEKFDKMVGYYLYVEHNGELDFNNPSIRLLQLKFNESYNTLFDFIEDNLLGQAGEGKQWFAEAKQEKLRTKLVKLTKAFLKDYVNIAKAFNNTPKDKKEKQAEIKNEFELQWERTGNLSRKIEDKELKYPIGGSRRKIVGILIGYKMAHAFEYFPTTDLRIETGKENNINVRSEIGKINVGAKQLLKLGIPLIESKSGNGYRINKKIKIEQID